MPARKPAVLTRFIAIACASLLALHAAKAEDIETNTTTMTRTIILVRHAEKAPAGGRDPLLSQAGEARAQALASALAKAGITAIVTSPYQRTQSTAQPLAKAMGITPQVVDAAVPAVVSALKAMPGEGSVLVVGHSNTVPGIIAALGGPVLADLPEESFNQLFVLLPGSPPSLVQAQYGATSP